MRSSDDQACMCMAFRMQLGLLHQRPNTHALVAHSLRLAGSVTPGVVSSQTQSDIASHLVSDLRQQEIPAGHLRSLSLREAELLAYRNKRLAWEVTSTVNRVKGNTLTIQKTEQRAAVRQQTGSCCPISYKMSQPLCMQTQVNSTTRAKNIRKKRARR